jgi:hypothetical protein
MTPKTRPTCARCRFLWFRCECAPVEYINGWRVVKDKYYDGWAMILVHPDIKLT